MAERIVYLGPFNNKKRDELSQKAIDYLRDNKGDKFYYLLPNGELLKHYRRSFIESVENLFEINVFTFDDIVNKVIKDLTIETISNPMKNALIKETLISLSENNKINYFKDAILMEGFIKSCNSIIGEIKRSLVSTLDYEKNCPDIVSFKEIGQIYSEYESLLEGLNLSDREGDYLKCIELLKGHNGFLEDLEFVIIDEFYDFRPIEMAILRELTKMDIDIYINIPFETENNNSIINLTLKRLTDLGFIIEHISKQANNNFEEIASLLFTGKRDIFRNIENLQLIKSNSIYLEYKKIFEEIKIHNSNGTPLHDMGIVVTNNTYLEGLFKVANEEGIDINRSKTMALMDAAIIKEFLNILENIFSNGCKITLINRIKSVYFSIVKKVQAEGLELVIRKQNFKTINELENLLVFSKKSNYPIEYFEPLKNSVVEILEEISSIPLLSTIDNYIELLLNILNKFEIDKLLLDRYKISNNFNLYIKESKIIDELRNAIIQTSQLSLIKAEIHLEDYYRSLVDYLSEIEITEESGNLMGIRIYDPVNIRGFSNKVLFIVGLSQGNYPNLKSENYLLKEENKSILKDINIQYKDYEDRFNNENLKFASAISTCVEILYLSYSGSSQNEGLGIPSMFLDELFSLLEGKKIEDKLNITTVDLAYLIKSDINKVTTNKDLSNYLLYNYFNTMTVDKEYFHLHNKIYKDKLENINSKLQSEIGRLTNVFDIYRGKLSDKEIIDDINSKLGERSYSISYLESYSKCPFFFLLNNYFKIEEMERSYEEYRPIDIGNIYHQALRWFYLQYSNEIREYIINGIEFPNIKSLENLKNYMEAIFKEFLYELELNNNKIILESSYEKLVAFIKADMDRLSDPKEKLLPYELEKEFKDFEIELDGEKITMMGVIDRIDKLLNKNAFAVMDYKSSTYGIRNLDDMKSGLSLQLPVYIMSLTERDVIAGLYGIIGSANFDVAIGILEETNIISNRHKGKMNRDEWDHLLEDTKINIFHIINGIKSGDFSVDPLECSPYCIYKDICRYEKKVEVE